MSGRRSSLSFNKHALPKASRRSVGSQESSEKFDDICDALLNDPCKRALLLKLLSQGKDGIKTHIQKSKKDTPVKKKKYHCESPTALYRRRALQEMQKQNDNSSSESEKSVAASPVPFESLLNGVIAYVEVKTRDGDKSSAIKSVIRAMGATVKDQFLKDVTHVIFKDGSFNTYRKAKLLKVHLVSLLWVEAVKTNHRRVPEKNYPALGIQPFDANLSFICQKIQKDYDEALKEECNQSLKAPQNALHESIEDCVPNSQDCEVQSIISNYQGGQCPDSSTSNCAINLQLSPYTTDSDISQQGMIDGKITQGIIERLETSSERNSLSKSNGSRNSLNDKENSKPLNSTTSDFNFKRNKTSHSCIDMNLTDNVQDQQLICLKDSNKSSSTGKNDSSATLSGLVTKLSLESGEMPSLRLSSASSSNNVNNCRRLSHMSGDKRRTENYKFESCVVNENLTLEKSNDVENMACTGSQRRISRRRTILNTLNSPPNQPNKESDHTEGKEKIQIKSLKNRDQRISVADVVNKASLESGEMPSLRLPSISSDTNEDSAQSDTRNHKFDSSVVNTNLISEENNHVKNIYSATKKTLSKRHTPSKLICSPPKQQRWGSDCNQVKETPQKRRSRKICFKDNKNSTHAECENKGLDVNITEVNQVSKNSNFSTAVNSSGKKDNKQNETENMSTKVCTNSDTVVTRPKRRLYDPDSDVGSSLLQVHEDTNQNYNSTTAKEIIFKKPIVVLTPVLVTVKAKKILDQKASKILPKKSPLDKGKPVDISDDEKQDKDGTCNLAKVGSTPRRSKRLSQLPKESSSSNDDSVLPITPIKRRSTLEFSSQEIVKSVRMFKQKGRPSIVCTRLHRSEHEVFLKIVGKLGRFIIEDEVSAKTTHLVAGECKRTINLLRAIARGCWIVRIEWLYKSLEAGKWLPETGYELTEFSQSVQHCRLERQAFGPDYTIDIFQNCGWIYVARSTTPRCSDLQELVRLCKGKVTTTHSRAKIVIGEFIERDDVTCVKETWILDSIAENIVKPYKNYLLKPN